MELLHLGLPLLVVVVEVNCETGEIIEREMNAQEIAQRKADQEEAAIRAELEAQEAEAQANAKVALLDRLGITEAEAKLLLS
jgi:hypothetical protein